MRDSRTDHPGMFADQVPAVYEELKELAAGQLRQEAPGHTLNPTALVHEAYVRLADRPGSEVRDRTHLLALSAQVMRRVLVDHARRRNAVKRGGDWIRTTLSGKPGPAETDPAELLALDAALEQLHERQRQVVELRFYAALSDPEIAQALGISTRTVRREWVKARAWLYSTLYPDD